MILSDIIALAQAGFTADEITALAGQAQSHALNNPTAPAPVPVTPTTLPQAQTPVPTPVPAQVPTSVPAPVPAQVPTSVPAPVPAPVPTPEPETAGITKRLDQLIGMMQANNMRMSMGGEQETAQDILANIINPKQEVK